jgi:hypothetical protein
MDAERAFSRTANPTQAVPARNCARFVAAAALAGAGCFAQARAATCESLMSLQLPNTTIHAVQSIRACLLLSCN